MSSTSESGEAGRELPQVKLGGPLAGHEDSPLQQGASPLSGSLPSPANGRDWNPAEQESLIPRQLSLTGLVNPALLSGSAAEHFYGGTPLPAPAPSAPNGGEEPPVAGSNPLGATAQEPPRSGSRPASPNKRPPPGSSPRKPPLPPGSQSRSSAAESAAASRWAPSGGVGSPANDVALQQEQLDREVDQPLLMGSQPGGECQERPRPHLKTGFGIGPPRFAPETAMDASGPTESAKARQRHLSLPNMIGSLFGMKPPGQTETAIPPRPEGVTHLRGGSFGLPNYTPGMMPPPALASANSGRPWARAGSWAPGQVVLVVPKPLVGANIKKPDAKTDAADAPLSDAVVEDREEELLEEDPLCRICLDQLIMDGMEAMRMQCKCRGELALAHKECAVKWFSIRGSRICDVCGSEVENLPVLVYRRPAPRALVPMRPPGNMVPLDMEEMRQEPPGTCLDYPVLVLAAILLHFCFIQQLLVKDLKQTAVLVAFPFGCLLGVIVSVTSRATVSRLFVWLFAAFEFFLIVIYTQIFYKLLRNYEPFTSENPLAAILGLLLGAFCGLGTALGLHTIVTEIGVYLRGRRQVRPPPPSEWEQERAISDFWGTDWDDLSVRSYGSRWSRERPVGGGGPASPPRTSRWAAPSFRNPRSTRTVTPIDV